MALPEKEIKPAVSILNLNSRFDRLLVSDTIRNGGVVGAQTITVGLWVDTTNPAGVAEINRIKGRNPNSRLALMVPELEGIIEIIDYDRVDPQLHSIIQNPQEFSHRISGKSLVKIPVKPHSKYHGCDLTPHLDPDNEGGWLLFLHFGKVHPNAQKLVEELYQHSGLIAATSMNKSGRPTITGLAEAIDFCSQAGIPYFMKDPIDPFTDRRGSYPLIAIGKPGEILPKQQITLKQSVNLLRPQSNLQEEHIYFLWPEVYPTQKKPLAEILPSIFFQLAANRTAPELLVTVYSLAKDALKTRS